MGFALTAYLDIYAGYNFNRPPTAGIPESSGPTLRPANNTLHLYDFYSNQLGLALIELSVQHVRPSTRFILDLDFGQNADANAAIANSEGDVILDDISKHIGQVVLSWTPAGADNLTIELGKMPTHIGLEVMKAKDNWNYSRSVLFSYGGPFWHTGLHAGYGLVPGKFWVNGYLYRGWTSLYDNNSSLTLGSQLKYVPTEGLAIAYNYIGGAEQEDNNSDLRQVHELNASWNVMADLAIAADLLTGQDEGVVDGESARWHGAQVGAKWSMSPRAYLAPRIELYRDSNGYTIGRGTQSISTFTLTQGLRAAEGLEFRFEGRYDHSTSATQFVGRSGAQKATQATGTVALLYQM